MPNRKILVVDDEKDILNLYGEAFKLAGFEVHAADTAEAAYELFKKEKFWVLFLDLNLPGMSGVDLCRKLKSEYPMIIPYAVTGYASLFELSDCREAGFEDYFTKPVSLSTLVDAAEQAFKKIDRWKAKG